LRGPGVIEYMGRPPSVPTADVARAIALHPEPVVTASDIHTEIGLSQAGARERLKSLAEEGYLGQKQAGGSALVFWLRDKGKCTLGDAIDAPD